jgi:hypothetical protein
MQRTLAAGVAMSALLLSMSLGALRCAAQAPTPTSTTTTTTPTTSPPADVATVVDAGVVDAGVVRAACKCSDLAFAGASKVAAVLPLDCDHSVPCIKTLIDVGQPAQK